MDGAQNPLMNMWFEFLTQSSTLNSTFLLAVMGKSLDQAIFLCLRLKFFGEAEGLNLHLKGLSSGLVCINL